MAPVEARHYLSPDSQSEILYTIEKGESDSILFGGTTVNISCDEKDSHGRIKIADLEKIRVSRHTANQNGNSEITEEIDSEEITFAHYPFERILLISPDNHALIIDHRNSNVISIRQSTRGIK